MGNPGIHAGWNQLCEYANKVIERNCEWSIDCASGYYGTEGPPSKWFILSPETGTGKTLSLAAYCALLRKETGALVVVHLMKAADEFAEQVNQLAGDRRAVALHSTSEGVSLEAAARHQVVVITHAAFVSTLESAAVAQRIGKAGSRLGLLNRWKTLERYKGTRRPFIAVDETFPVFAHAMISRGQLEELVANNFSHLSEHFPKVLTALNFLRNLYGKTEVELSGKKTELVLGRKHSPEWWDKRPELSECIAECIAMDPRSVFAGPAFESSADYAKYGEKVRDEYMATMPAQLGAALALLRETILYSPAGRSGVAGRSTFSTAWQVLPDGAPNMIILDATGRVNRTYDLLGDQCQRVPRPRGARNYSDLTILISYWKTGLGKGASTKRVAERGLAWVRSIEKQCGDPVLVFSHKGALTAKQHAHNLGTYLPDGWEAVNYMACSGTNAFKRFRAVALYSLLYRPRRQSVAEMIAAFGARIEDKDRIDSYVEEANAGQIASEAVQAINRGCCRSAIDEFGNCLPMKAFIPLPNDATGKRIRELILEQFPGAKVEEWDIGDLGGIKKQKSAYRLAEYLSRAARQRVPLHEVKAQLGFTKKVWESLSSVLADAKSEAFRLLAKAGYVYVAGGGRGNHSHFLRKEGA